MHAVSSCIRVQLEAGLRVDRNQAGVARYLYICYSDLLYIILHTARVDDSPMNITIRIGKRGTIVIPAAIRRRLGLEEGDLVITEDMGDGILIRPAAVIPIETYTPERRAEFILTNAVDEQDYERARDVVRSMGIDPDNIEHERPGG